MRFAGRKNLSLHEHFVIESVPMVELELGGQLRHALASTAPASGENVPTEQSAHWEAAWCENAPALQVWHVRRVVAPSTSDAVPAAQSMHDVAAPSVNVPFAHCWMTTS